MDQFGIQFRLGYFKVPSSPIGPSNLPTAAPSPPVESFVRDVEVRVVWPQILLRRRSPPVLNPPAVCFQGIPTQQVFFAVHDDCVRTPEVTSLAGAGGLVRTYKTVVIFKVGVSMSFDLSGVRVPVVACSDPAEYRLLPTEVGDRPIITALVTTAARFDNVTPAVVVLGDLAASVGV